ncbi:asparagine synthase (glutamine-hydrolyzing) [Variovorax sp. RB3P1]|uniref:asparagine synthase (glutamine-hydrolyzing) n=1 Tax=Variovorax sp. RB3P1 TaxID=3443732 RepID=UPI003F484E49
MCGIAGKWNRNSGFDAEYRVAEALTAMRRRGPDASGLVKVPIEFGEIAFGHARLSIIDLSEDGTQPMWSSDRRHLIVFNGEIFNYIELREQLRLAGHEFETKTDTEVLLAAWQHWGIGCLSLLEGMFAFAIYDAEKRKLTCVRDAFGIKPFFYQFSLVGFSFASDMLGIKALSEKPLEVNWQRAYDYLVHGDYDSTEDSFCAGVHHLKPGHLLEFDLESGTLSEPRFWWQPKIAQTTKISFKDASAELRARFLDNVRLQMRSDVRIGAALSGGVDSSSIVCAMRHLDPSAELRTFSYIAGDSKISEENWVDHVNSYCKAIPHKIAFENTDFLADLEDLVATQGEPFGGTSIYAQYRVFKAAKEAGVTVTLDGQGADELLCGYSGYPGPRMRSLMETGGLFEAGSFLRQWSKWPGRGIKSGLMYTAAEYSSGPLYSMMRSLYGKSSSPSWVDGDFTREHGIDMQQPRYGRKSAANSRGRRAMSAMATAITNRGLPGLLRHGDRNSMRFSVESRVPFLTTSLCDFLYSLPEEYLISPTGETKHLFRSAMRGIVPDALLNRKDKIGFQTPQKSWLFDPSIIKDLKNHISCFEGFADTKELERILSVKDLSNVVPSDWIWRLMNFQMWMRSLKIVK